MKSDNRKGIARLLELSGEKKGILIFSGVLAALSAALQVIPYIASCQIISIYVAASRNDLPPDTDSIVFWGVSAVVSVLIAIASNGGSFVLSHFAAFRIVFNLKMRLAEHLARLPLGFFTGTGTGEIHKCIHDNTDLIELFIAHKIPDLVMTLTGASVVFGLYLYADWRLGLICILVYAAALLAQFSMYGDQGAREDIRGYFTALENINSASMEFARGIPVFKMFSLSALSFSSLKKSVLTYRDFALGFAARGRRGFIIFTILVNFFVFFIFPAVIAINAAHPGDASIALTALLFTALSNAILPSLMNIMNISSAMMTISEGVERIDRIFAAEPLEFPEKTAAPAGFAVAFENVSFSCRRESLSAAGDSAPRQILRDISFRVEEGKSLAIIGRSGSGKSSILSLIARFHDADSGRITIGGADIRNISEKDLMDSVSIAMQQTFMFQGTIRDNIIGGKTGASDAEVFRAAHLAQCDDIIEKYGLDCPVGAGGETLSGGEKQRINIARAILKNAPVLLLDEVSSALDAENERLLNRALRELKKNKTIIMAAHRLDCIRDADQIIMLDRGEIMARGDHQSLMAESPEYRRLWELYETAGRWQLISDRDSGDNSK